MDHLDHDDERRRQSRLFRWALTGFLLVAAFFLWDEHRAHFLGALPYLLLLTCPLLHLFHHGHGHRHGHRYRDRPTDETP